MSGELWLLLGLGVLVALWGVPTGLSWLKNRRMVERVVAAELIEKKILEETGSGWETAEHYCLIFSFAGESPQTFFVSEKEYARRAVGEQGLLHLQGTWYRGFEPQDSPVKVSA